MLNNHEIIIHQNAQPILISPGDFMGSGKEYRYPLGPGLNCEMYLADGITLCNA